MPDQPSSAVQDYLKAIHSLGGVNNLVSPMDLASRLEVRAASVTGMLKRLTEGGWIDYEPGRGARLTPRGTAEARRVIRRLSPTLTSPIWPKHPSLTRLRVPFKREPGNAPGRGGSP